MPRHFSAAAVLLALASPLAGQDCPDLPPVPAPALEICSAGFRGILCRTRNDGRQDAFVRLGRGFTSNVRYNARSEAKPEAMTVDSIRGCRGENINIVITPGEVTYFEYQLTSPNDVVVADGSFRNWRGDRIIGRNVTLPQSGYYVLKTRTEAPGKTESYYDKKKGTTTSYTTFPRTFAVNFKTDANTAAMQVGEKTDATVSAAQPFIRRVSVKGGSKVRFRFASMGTGNFTATVLRASGEQLHRSKGPVAYDEVLAVTPNSDEIFTVRADPAPGVETVGMQFTVLDDKAAGTTIAMGDRVQSVFKLPAQYDYANNLSHKSVYATETARLTYRASAPEQIGLIVRPSGASGLTIRVRVYDEATEDLIVDEALTKPSTVLVNFARAGSWVISLAPLSASEMVQAGEARYTVEVQPAPEAASKTPQAPTTRSASPRPAVRAAVPTVKRPPQR